MGDLEFISQKNKALVWELLMEANAFINIPDSSFNKIQLLYEQIVNEISQFPNLSLKERNKMVISRMLEKIKSFNTETIQKP